MTRSEQDQASARAIARRAQIARASEQVQAMTLARQKALRASYERAESEAADVVRAGRSDR